MLNGLFPNYKVYCTSEQLNNALVLGAPFRTNIVPTVEQMIEWLKTQRIHIFAHRVKAILCHDYKTSITVWEMNNYNTIFHDDYFSSKEAVLTGINSALKYLTNKKK